MIQVPKLRVVFVAGFDIPSTGATGGQMATARNFANSELKDHAEFVHIASMAPAVLPWPERSLKAAKRLWRLMCSLPNSHVALIFGADGLGLIEKTLMAAIAKLSGLGVVMRISGGTVARQ